VVSDAEKLIGAFLVPVPFDDLTVFVETEIEVEVALAGDVLDEEEVGADAAFGDEAASGEFDGEAVGAGDGDAEECAGGEGNGDAAGDGGVFGGDFGVGGGDGAGRGGLLEVEGA